MVKKHVLNDVWNSYKDNLAVDYHKLPFAHPVGRAVNCRNVFGRGILLLCGRYSGQFPA